jgi:hypothetical protein
MRKLPPKMEIIEKRIKRIEEQKKKMKDDLKEKRRLAVKLIRNKPTDKMKILNEFQKIE